MKLTTYIFLLLAAVLIPILSGMIPAAASGQRDASLTSVKPHSPAGSAMSFAASSNSDIFSGPRMTVFANFLKIPRAIYTFTTRIFVVFPLRSFNQMVWAHTLRGVACVHQVFRPISVMKEPRDMVSVKNFTSSPTSADFSITAVSAGANPKPATGGLMDLLPESFSQRSADGHKAILPCDDSLWRRVYHPQRLIIKDACVSVTGVIVDATHGKRKDGLRHEGDGDTHGWLKVDPIFRGLLNAGNKSDEGGNLVFEVICKFRVTQKDAIAACRNFKSSVVIPPPGTRVRITGSLVQDMEHAKWMEIHPVTKIEVIQ